ncbi:hypothetical protein Tco_0650458 [Tanacetum coccineum]
MVISSPSIRIPPFMDLKKLVPISISIPLLFSHIKSIYERKGIFQKIAEVNKETLQDQLSIKNWTLMTIGILFRQIFDDSSVYSITKREVKFDIPNCTAFGTTAIIDTGASACFINKKVIPEEALEPLTQTVVFNGLNSNNNGIEMLKGANFLRSMKGGIRIEGDEITIYKKVTKIKTSNQTEIAEIAELKVSEEEFLEINESIYFNQEGSKAFQEQFKPVIDRLKQQGYIRGKNLKHWKKNGTIIDPTTEREVKGKERMVFNYKSLNDNTYKDQYSLPGINTIIKRIGGAKIFLKFDLKSGFHQVAMDEESIPGLHS